MDGSARIAVDLPERVEVEVDARTPAYLVLADTYDTGWTMTVAASLLRQAGVHAVLPFVLARR